MNSKFSLCLAVLLTLVCVSSVRAENWPNWRGPAHNGSSPETGLPTEFGPEKSVLWKVPMPGTGISNAVVWDDRVFVTASEGRDQGELHVICCDRDSGRERWHQRLWGTAPTLFYPRRPTSRSRNRLT